jgi:tetratricopeptide (TPR) repeat protein
MLFEQNKFIEAKPYLEQAIKFSSYMKTVDPIVYAAFVYDMGIVFEEQGKLDDAIGQYQKALDISETSAAHYRLARILANQGKFELSRPHFLRALAMAKAAKNEVLIEEIFRWLALLERKKQIL